MTLVRDCSAHLIAVLEQAHSTEIRQEMIQRVVGVVHVVAEHKGQRRGVILAGPFHVFLHLSTAKVIYITVYS